MTTFQESADRLNRSILMAVPALNALAESFASEPWGPDKWTRKQVLGHLIDSAANNHQRFVRGQQPGDLHIPPYVQDHWMAVQRYDERSWQDVIELWTAYNRHLVHVMARIPESFQAKGCTIGSNAPVTLGYLAVDYVDHIWHHLNQIGIAER